MTIWFVVDRESYVGEGCVIVQAETEEEAMSKAASVLTEVTGAEEVTFDQNGVSREFLFLE